MKTIIFVKTRHQYDSYTDFWKLVELSGFPTCFVDEIDMRRNVYYIVTPFNGEIYQRFPNNSVPVLEGYAKLILWNLERPGGSDSFVSFVADNLNKRRYFHKIVFSDRELVRDCSRAETGANKFFEYMPLGLHPGLGEVGDYQSKIYDIIHLACYSNRRSRLFDRPDKQKDVFEGCSVAPRGWGNERHEALLRSKFMYCTHQDVYNYIEPLRYTLAYAYGLPIIAEDSYDFHPYDPEIIVHHNGRLDTLVKFYDEYLWGKALAERELFIKEFPFEKIVRDVIEAL